MKLSRSIVKLYNFVINYNITSLPNKEHTPSLYHRRIWIAMMKGTALVPAVDTAQHIATPETYNTTDHRCFQKVTLRTLLVMHCSDMDCGEYLEHNN